MFEINKRYKKWKMCCSNFIFRVPVNEDVIAVAEFEMKAPYSLLFRDGGEMFGVFNLN